MIPYIHFPPECAQDPVIGSLLQPINEAQDKTYAAAVLAKQQYDDNNNFCLNMVKAHIGHNLFVAGRKFMPFSIVSGPEIVIEPYSRWQGYEHLMIVEDGGISMFAFIYTSCDQLPEHELLRCLLLFRRNLVQALHPLDIIAVNAAVVECIHQIDKQRMRQRKRCETVP